MESVTSATSSSTLRTPFLPSLTRSSTIFSPTIPTTNTRPKSLATRVVAAGAIRRSNSYGSGRIVDEGMIVLRKRIHEMEIIENNYTPPSHWMEWEKQIYASYDDVVCKGVGLLQSQLMDLRPSVAIGFITLIGMSVPTSVLLLGLRVVAAASSGAGGCNLGM